MLRTNTLNFVQNTPLSTWEITHNLNCAPNCDVYTVIDGVNQKLYPLDIVYVDPNTVQIVFSSPRTGGARLAGNYIISGLDLVGGIDPGGMHVGNAPPPPPPSFYISTHPQNYAIPVPYNPDAPISFTVTASGNGPLTYKWEYKEDPDPTATWFDVEWLGAESALTASLSFYGSQWTADVEAQPNYYFRCVVTDTSTNQSLASNTAALTTQFAPSSSYPELRYYESAANIDYPFGYSYVEIFVLKGSRPMSFVWEEKDLTSPTADWVPIAQADTTSESFNLIDTITGGIIWDKTDKAIRCTATNAYGTLVRELTEFVVIIDPPVITQQPTNITITTDDLTQNNIYSFTLSYYGTQPISAQWYRNGEIAPGNSTEDSYRIFSPTMQDSGASYYVVLSNSAGTVTSDTVTFTVVEIQPVQITTQPSNIEILHNSEASFSVEATGTGVISYQWYAQDFSDQSFYPVPGATASSYTFTQTQWPSYKSYYVVVSDEYGNSIQSNTVTATVNKAPVVITYSPERQAIEGTTPNNFIVSTSGTQPITYQWFKNGVEVSTGTTQNTGVFGLTNSLYSFTAELEDDGAQLYVIATNQYGSVQSPIMTLTVYELARIITQPVNASVTFGNQASFSVVATGSEPISYQWVRNGLVIDGATNATYSFIPEQSQNGDTFSVYVSAFPRSWEYGEPSTVQSNTVTLTVTEQGQAPVISVHPSDAIVNPGDNTSFSVTATGSEPMTYNWQESSDNGVTWSDVQTGGVAPIITVHPSDANVNPGDNTSFSVTATGSEPMTYNWQESSDNGVTWNDMAPVITVHPNDTTVNEGQSTSLSVTATGSEPMTYTWQESSDNGVTWSNSSVSM